MTFAGCFSLVFLLLLTKAQGQGRGAIRLFANGESSATLTSGIVQIFYDNKWNSICDINTGIHTPDTICRQLGYVGGDTSNLNFGNDLVDAALSGVNCNYNSLNVLQCSFTTSTFDCTSQNDLAVQCDDITLIEFSGSVRLAGETRFTGSGLVEVYCNGEWGLVCNTGFNRNDANTVCRQLGFTVATNHGIYRNDTETQNIWLDTPGCGASTSCLSNCKHCPSQPSTACAVNTVAGITCSYESNNDYSGKNDVCLFSDSSINIAAVVVGCIVALLVCAVAAVAIPLLICCCLGVGIGAAAGRRKVYDTI